MTDDSNSKRQNAHTRSSAGPIPDLSAISSPPRRHLDYKSLKEGKIIGSGGQATIRRVELSSGQPPDVIAVKEPHQPTQTIDRSVVESFFQEARTWKALDTREREETLWTDSEHIVGVVDVGEQFPWIAIEYMDGGSLADRLKANPDGLPLQEGLWIGECLCRGVKIAHDYGVAHLDLKPDNVLFRGTPEAKWDVPKIADWGLARVLIENYGSMNALSVEYAAPEQFSAGRFGNPDKYTDIYQLGALVYTLLTGSPPFTGSQPTVMHDVLSEDPPIPPSEQRSMLPERADKTVLNALKKDKSDRYAGVEQFGESLRVLRTQIDAVSPEHSSGNIQNRVSTALNVTGTIEDKIPAQNHGRNGNTSDQNIVVVGAGKGGTNAVNRLSNIGVDGAKTVAVDTDDHHLKTVEADEKILVCDTLLSAVDDALANSDLVFVIAGLTEETGVYAANKVSKIAKEKGDTVVGMVTIPFGAEDNQRAKAEEGLETIRNEVDTAIVLDNNRLLDYVPNLPAKKVLTFMDQIIAESVKYISETITQPSLINLDHTVMSTIMNQGGVSVMLIGETQDKNKTQVVDDAVNSPLHDVDYRGASGGIIHIMGGPNLTLEEINDITNGFKKVLQVNGDVAVGVRTYREYAGKVRAIVIITGVQYMRLNELIRE